jgi:HEPN domain-containing protein
MSGGIGASAMNKTELQQLTTERLRDAKALLTARRWSGAYYLAGYAVECALKACVIVRLMKTDQFPERRYSEQCWTHNLEQLFAVAGLKAAFDADLAVDANLETNWTILRDWDESSRYAQYSKNEARLLYEAIIDKKHGVLPWIKSRW